MTGVTARRVTIAGLRLVVGGVFAYAGTVKLGSPQALADSIASFEILPGILVNPMALALPPFEIAVGLWLICGWHQRSAAFCTVIATGIFLLALLTALWRGIPVDCGCFGASSYQGSPRARVWLDVGRDFLLLVAAGTIYLDAWFAQYARQHRNESVALG